MTFVGPRPGQVVPTASPGGADALAALPVVPAGRTINHGRNVVWTPRLAFAPGKDIDELVRVQTWITTHVATDVSTKAGGSRHAWSPASATDGVYIHPEHMSFVEPLAGRPGLFRVGAGTRFRDLNLTLWDAGYSLPVLGGFDGQTLAGALSTGTHGSVLRSAPLAETLVESVDLVTPLGRKVRIEPADGRTEPRSFEQTHPDWDLVQDDTSFRAALLSLGTLGVVHSYVIAAAPRFYLRERRTLTTGHDAQNALVDGGIYRVMAGYGPLERTEEASSIFPGHPAKAYHFEMLWNAHTDKLLVTSRQPVPTSENSRLQKTAADDPFPSRSLLRSLTVPSIYSRPRLGVLVFDKMHSLVNLWTGVANALWPKQAGKRVDALITAGPDHDGFIGRSYNVFNIGDGLNALNAESATLSVPLAGDAYLEAMEIMRRVAQDYLQRHGECQSGPISLRFVKGGQALLGDPVDVCKFEIIFSGHDARAIRLSKNLVSAYDTALRARFGDAVGFHLGQLVPTTREEPLTSAGAKAFNRVRRRFDPEGRASNAWQRKLFAEPNGAQLSSLAGAAD